LIEHKANIEARDKKDGLTPLIGTFFHNHIDTARYLIEAGANIMTRRNDDTGITPLVNAVALQRTELANIICEQGLYRSNHD
jgi:ankyrin repeat protein